MAETIGRNEHVNSWLLFNEGDSSEPSERVIYELCSNLTASGPRMRCHISRNTSCPDGRKCAASTIFQASKHIAKDMAVKCNFVIKLDPDCVFIPNAALEFVRGISPNRRVFYGTFSGKLVYSGYDHIWLRTQMPKGNWMVSIKSWNMMVAVAAERRCSPNTEYAGTDEAAALLCAWYSYAADCVTNWRDYVRIGPAAETKTNLQEHVDRVKAKPELHACVMLVHKYLIEEMVPLYHEYQSLNHKERECGISGTVLQNTTDYDYNRAAVIGYKFPNKAVVDSEFDCANQDALPTSGIRTPPDWVINEGLHYTGPTGAAAKHFTERMFHPKDKGQPGGAKT